MKSTHRVVRVVAGVAVIGTALFGFAGSASAVPSPDSTCAVLHHSDTGNGANTTGPYNNTCGGPPSGNGVGGGLAKGQPCAGCVGNADDKNPPGQLPGPEDNNNGYECDGNNGIARTNPAHTGCQPPSS